MKVLGSLEKRVMDILWVTGPLGVRQVMTQLKGKLAYTTIMTTLDRLYKKGLLARDRVGTAYIYRAVMSEDDYHCSLVEDTVGSLLEKSAGPVLAAFVNTAAELDEGNLKKLEALIAQRRRRKK